MNGSTGAHKNEREKTHTSQSLDQRSLRISTCLRPSSTVLLISIVGQS